MLVFKLSPPSGARAPYFFFADENGRLVIWQYATDPDGWRYLEFEKRGAGRAVVDGSGCCA
jgi:hypothetical protein